jgi:hypothetical protein
MNKPPLADHSGAGRHGASADFFSRVTPRDQDRRSKYAMEAHDDCKNRIKWAGSARGLIGLHSPGAKEEQAIPIGDGRR